MGATRERISMGGNARVVKPRVTASGASARRFSLLAGSLCSPTQRFAIRRHSRAATKLAVPKESLLVS